MVIGQLLCWQPVGPHAFIGGSFDKTVAEGEAAEIYRGECFLHAERFSAKLKNLYQMPKESNMNSTRIPRIMRINTDY